MAKELWKPGNMLYPLPVVMVSVADKSGKPNIITVAWAGTICSDPAMETREFVINLTTRELAFTTDYCGVKSGRDVDKFKEMNLTALPASIVKAPLIAESPVNLECQVTEIKELGSHDMFMAKVVAVHADEKYMDENHKFHLEWADPITYSHGVYYTCGERLGSFGYSVRKK